MARTVSVDSAPGATSTPDPTPRVSRRRDRYSAREILWRESSLKRVRFCGRFASGDSVVFRASGLGAERTSGLAGVQSCGSVWSCPVCSEKVNAARQSELQAGIDRWLAEGHAVVFGTLTVRHHKKHRLADLWDAIGPSWNRTTSGAGVVWNGSKSKKANREIGDKARFGIRGYVRVVETKHGERNGWHPHIHFLLFLEEALTAQQTSDLESRMFARWETALAKRGLTVERKVAIDLRPVKDSAMADYFYKGTYARTSASAAAYEVTGSHSKKAGKGGRTPFELLESVVTVGDADDLDRWHEWEKASKGRRQLTWSRGLRALLQLDVELTDEEIVAEDAGGDDLASVSADQYASIAKTPGRLLAALEACEADDTGLAIVTLLDSWGYWYTDPRERRPERANRLRH